MCVSTPSPVEIFLNCHFIVKLGVSIIELKFAKDLLLSLNLLALCYSPELTVKHTAMFLKVIGIMYINIICRELIQQDQFPEIKQTFFIIYLDGDVDIEIYLKRYACSHTKLSACPDCLYKTFHFSFFKILFESFKTCKNLGIRNIFFSFSAKHGLL